MDCFVGLFPCDPHPVSLRASQQCVPLCSELDTNEKLKKNKKPKQTKTQITKANVEMSVDTFQFQSLLGKCTKNMKKTSPSVKFSAAYLRESDY